MLHRCFSRCLFGLVSGFLALGLGGCGPGGSPSVPIGLNVELTGEMPAVGRSSRNAAELFVEQLNSAGGLKIGGEQWPIRLVVGDNGAKAEQAAAVAQRLISQDEVVAMVGPNASVCAIPASEIAEALRCVMVSPWSTNPKTTVDATTGKSKNYVFRACFTDLFQARVLAKFVKNDLKAQTAAVLFDVASEAPNGQANKFKADFEALGGQVVAFETYTTGDRDFSAQLTKIRAANPEVVFLPTYYNDVPLIIEQARRLGLNAQFVGSDAWSSPEIITLGGANVEGSYFCNHYSSEIATPIAQKFMSDYEARYGQKPDDVAALTYDTLGLLAQAIAAAGSTDREAIRNALASITEFVGVTGTMKFEPGSGDPIKSAVILQIRDGAFDWVTNAQP